MPRIDTHHHMIPPDYAKLLQDTGIADAGGRALRDAHRHNPRRLR
jgi:6-methylsalicylate decarboxylase